MTGNSFSRCLNDFNGQDGNIFSRIALIMLGEIDFFYCKYIRLVPSSH